MVLVLGLGAAFFLGAAGCLVGSSGAGAEKGAKSPPAVDFGFGFGFGFCDGGGGEEGGDEVVCLGEEDMVGL